jgi:hypothetical protein
MIAKNYSKKGSNKNGSQESWRIPPCSVKLVPSPREVTSLIGDYHGRVSAKTATANESSW